jgi:YD repeat-containing protein
MTYDAIGNLTSKTGVGAYQYGSNLNGTGVGPYQARKVNGATYSYDANGNLTSAGGWTYSWNADNTLAGMTNGSAPESYTYDADGERVVRIAAGVTTVFFEGVWEQTSGGTTTLYSQDLASPLTQIVQSKAGSATPTDYVYGLNGIALLNGSTTTWYAQDARGSVRRTFNGGSATPLGIVNYDPW